LDVVRAISVEERARMEAEKGTPIPSVDPTNFGLNAPDPESKTKKRADDLVALSRVSAAISSLSDLGAILRIGLHNVLDIMGGAAGGIMLLDEQTKTLSYYVYHQLSATYAQEMYISFGEGIAGKVAQSGRPILIEDLSLEPNAALPELIGIEGLKSFLCIPLQAKGAVLGVLNLASRMARRFTKRDMHLLHSIGDLLSIAIEQTKLYEQLRKGSERYRQLARQTLLTEEEERRRIAFRSLRLLIAAETRLRAARSSSMLLISLSGSCIFEPRLVGSTGGMPVLFPVSMRPLRYRNSFGNIPRPLLKASIYEVLILRQCIVGQTAGLSPTDAKYSQS